MASDRQLREWISDRLVTFLVRPNRVSVQDVITLVGLHSGRVLSACDLVTKLVELGFTSSAETFIFASDIYSKVPRKAIFISNVQMQEKVAADPVEEQKVNNLSSDKGSDDDYSQLQGSKGMLSKVESDSVDDEEQGRANDSGRNVGGATEKEDEEDDDNCSDDMEGEVYLQQWVTDKLITLLDYPKSIGAKEIIRLAEDCSSTDDLVCMLVKSGFRSSSETCSFGLDIYAKVTRRASIIGKLYQEDVVNRDVEEEEVIELYLNTIENNEAHRQKYKMPEADYMHENAGEEKRLSVVLPQYEDIECKGNRSPETEEKVWVEHQGKPGLKYGCIDKKLSSDDNLYVSEVIDFVKSPVVEETMDGNDLDEEDTNVKYMFKRDIQDESKTLSVNKFRDALLKAVQEHQVIVIADETGSGKTTQLPQYLHEAGYTVKGKIACVQPHRVAALSVAARVSKEMGVNLGDEVGFSLRFEDLSSEGTVIKYTTAGVLLRELIVDPDLSSYSVVMIADATERTLPSDILFGLLKVICQSRPDLKLLIGSASLNVKKLQDYFCSAPVFKIHGRQCPVEIYHTKAPVPDYIDAVADTVMQIHMKTAGHILVFLPGEQQAQKVHEILDQKIKGLEKMPYKLIMCPIYANLPVDLAKTLKAATPSDRKVILVNDIAKVPPTIDGIKYVIDTGFCTLKSYNPRLGIEYLLICPISKASAKERAGMSGLIRPQKCYRLYTRDSYIHDLEGCTAPEIQRNNLAPVTLILKTLGINDLVHFPYLNPPPTEAMLKALNQIYGLGALNSRGQLTKTGRRMVEFPLDPLLSKMIVASEKYSCSVEAITIASMLSIGKSIFCCPKNRKDHADLARMNFHTGNVGDHIALLNVYNLWKESGYSTQWCHENYIQADSMKRAKQIRDWLERILEMVEIELCSNANDLVSIKKAITSGFFYHAARQHKGGIYRTIKNPQTVHIDPKSGLAEVCPLWVIFHEIVFDTGNHIGQVTEVKPEWLLEIAPHIYKNEDIADSGSKKLPEDGLCLPNPT